jgi:hypothetical protein
MKETSKLGVLIPLFLFLILSTSVISQTLDTKDTKIIKEEKTLLEASLESELKTKLTKEADLEVEEIIKDRPDIYIKERNNTLSMKYVKEPEKISKIEFKQNNNFGSDILTVHDAEFYNATVVLKKYYEDELRLLYSKDGINFGNYAGDYFQNTTHIWFYPEHFSSFTSSMPDIFIFGDSAISQLNVDLNDFATIEATHRSYMTHIIIDGSSSGNTGYNYVTDSVFCRTVEDSTNDDVYEVCAYEDNSYDFFTNLVYASDFTDDSSGIRFTLLDSLENVEDTISNIYIEYKTNFEQPEPEALSVITYGETTATLRGRVYFNDVGNIHTYYSKDSLYDYDNPRTAQFCWREGTSGYYTCDTATSISSDSIFTKSLTSLTPGTLHQYYINFFYYDPTIDSYAFDSSTVVSFTTDSDEPMPTVTTLTASDTISSTGTTATIRGIADFDDYSSAIDGYICYRVKDSGDYDCGSAQTISEDTIFTRSLTGLTPDTTYEYFAEITWDSGTETHTGSVLEFTPTETTTVEGDLT